MCTIYDIIEGIIGTFVIENPPIYGLSDKSANVIDSILFEI